MAKPSSYRRPALLNRPWIAGKLYDDLSRPSILHLDAYVFTFGGNEYLQLDWREGGSKLIALDTWLVRDGLTPVWDMHRSLGALTYNADPTLHARVVHQAREATTAGRWARVSTLCHYIDAREIDAEAGLGEPLAKVTRSKPGLEIDASNLPDIL